MAVDADEVWEDVEEAKQAAFESGCLHVNVEVIDGGISGDHLTNVIEMGFILLDFM